MLNRDAVLWLVPQQLQHRSEQDLQALHIVIRVFIPCVFIRVLTLGDDRLPPRFEELFYSLMRDDACQEFQPSVGAGSRVQWDYLRGNAVLTLGVGVHSLHIFEQCLPFAWQGAQL